MWQGVFPAVTTKFDQADSLDHAEMERCFGLLVDAGCDGTIVGGSLGEGPMLSPQEKLAVFSTARKVAGNKPVLMTINEAGTREACERAMEAAKAGADGIMLVPSMVYHASSEEAVASMRMVAAAGGLPVMIYSNRVAYKVDVTIPMMEELAADPLFVAVKESSDDIRRSTEIINAMGTRYDLFTGVDNLAFEALSIGAIGWVAGLVTAFPRETVAIYQLMPQGRTAEALATYRWFRPLLDLDVSTWLVQNIKLAEVHAIGTNDRVRMPRQPLKGERRAMVEKIVRDALDTRPTLPSF